MKNARVVNTGDTDGHTSQSEQMMADRVQHNRLGLGTNNRVYR
jgi:hypothetical protein